MASDREGLHNAQVRRDSDGIGKSRTPRPTTAFRSLTRHSQKVRERAARARDAAGTGRDAVGTGPGRSGHRRAPRGSRPQPRCRRGWPGGSPATPSVAAPWRNGASRAVLLDMRRRGHWKRLGGFSDSHTRSRRTRRRSDRASATGHESESPHGLARERCRRLHREQPGSRDDPKVH